MSPNKPGQMLLQRLGERGIPKRHQALGLVGLLHPHQARGQPRQRHGRQRPGAPMQLVHRSIVGARVGKAGCNSDLWVVPLVERDARRVARYRAPAIGGDCQPGFHAAPFGKGDAYAGRAGRDARHPRGDNAMQIRATLRRSIQGCDQVRIGDVGAKARQSEFGGRKHKFRRSQDAAEAVRQSHGGYRGGTIFAQLPHPEIAQEIDAWPHQRSGARILAGVCGIVGWRHKGRRNARFGKRKRSREPRWSGPDNGGFRCNYLHDRLLARGFRRCKFMASR